MIPTSTCNAEFDEHFEQKRDEDTKGGQPEEVPKHAGMHFPSLPPVFTQRQASQWARQAYYYENSRAGVQPEDASHNAMAGASAQARWSCGSGPSSFAEVDELASWRAALPLLDSFCLLCFAFVAHPRRAFSTGTCTEHWQPTCRTSRCPR